MDKMDSTQWIEGAHDWFNMMTVDKMDATQWIDRIESTRDWFDMMTMSVEGARIAARLMSVDELGMELRRQQAVLQTLINRHGLEETESGPEPEPEPQLVAIRHQIKEASDVTVWSPSGQEWRWSSPFTETRVDTIMGKIESTRGTVQIGTGSWTYHPTLGWTFEPEAEAQPEAQPEADTIELSISPDSESDCLEDRAQEWLRQFDPEPVIITGEHLITGLYLEVDIMERTQVVATIHELSDTLTYSSNPIAHQWMLMYCKFDGEIRKNPMWEPEGGVVWMCKEGLRILVTEMDRRQILEEEIRLKGLFERLKKPTGLDTLVSAVSHVESPKQNPNYYNHRTWPSPIPRLLVIHLNLTTNKRIKHADALALLASCYNCSVEEFLTKSREEVAKQLIGGNYMHCGIRKVLSGY